MYASNVEEDWVYLHETSPPNARIYEKAVSLSDNEGSSSSSSSSSSLSSSSSSSTSLSSRSSSSGCSPKRMRNTSMSSTEFQRLLNEDILVSSTGHSTDHDEQEEETRVLETEMNDDSLILYHSDEQKTNSKNQLLVIDTVNDSDDLSSEIMFLYDNDDSNMELSMNTNRTMNEDDAFDIELKHDRTISSIYNDRCNHTFLSTATNFRHHLLTQQDSRNNTEATRTTPISREMKPQKCFKRRQNSNNRFMYSIYIILLVVLPLILGHIIVQWDQPLINKLVAELGKTNQHLHNLKSVSIGNMEERLTKQLEDKLQDMVYQRSAWHDQEKSTFSLQILELREILRMTQRNLTDTIHQLTKENGLLQEKIKLLEHRLEGTLKQDSKKTKTCIEGVNCTKSNLPTYDKLVSGLFMKTLPNATRIPVILSGFLDYLHVTVNRIIDHRQEFLKKSKRKLKQIASSSAAATVQKSFHRGIDNMFASIGKAKSAYIAWFKSRAQTHERHHAEHNEKHKRHRQIHRNYAWRWTLQNGLHREHVRNQTPIREHICHSKSYFPMNKICLIKNWMIRFLRS